MNGYNFTEDERRTLAGAREESLRLHHEYVGTEHILLALTQTQRATTATKMLQGLNVDPEQVRRNVEAIVKRGTSSTDSPHELPYTSRAKKVLELAMLEARELGHSYVGTEHLLLGILREQSGIGGQALT